jgi:hypothetical protein
LGDIKQEAAEAARKLLRAQELLEAVETHFGEIELQLTIMREYGCRTTARSALEKLIKTQNIVQSIHEMLFHLPIQFILDDLCVPDIIRKRDNEPELLDILLEEVQRKRALRASSSVRLSNT